MVAGWAEAGAREEGAGGPAALVGRGHRRKGQRWMERSSPHPTRCGRRPLQRYKSMLLLRRKLRSRTHHSLGRQRQDIVNLQRRSAPRRRAPRRRPRRLQPRRHRHRLRPRCPFLRRCRPRPRSLRLLLRSSCCSPCLRDRLSRLEVVPRGCPPLPNCLRSHLLHRQGQRQLRWKQSCLHHCSGCNFARPPRRRQRPASRPPRWLCYSARRAPRRRLRCSRLRPRRRRRWEGRC